jgi:Ca-activated chloride channel family protein
VEQLAAPSSHGRLRHRNSYHAAAGSGRLRARRQPRACSAAQSKLASPSGSRRKASLFVLAAILFAFAPLWPLKAQSGRRRPEPSATPAPNTQRPRRATPARPAENVPGQPATPDAPSANTITPTPTPAPDNNITRTPQPTGAATPQTPQSDESVEVDDGDIVRVSSNLVPVSATVTDTRGKAITDLTVDDFELRVDGQPKPIGGLSHAETPVRMVMLFDNSDSIRSSREFEKQAAIRFFKSVLRPVDQAAIYSVGTVFDLVQPLTNDVQRLVRTIERFDKPEGATKLMDAMAHAAEYLRLVPGRKVLVIVSDGSDTISDLTYDETLRRVLAADCQVYAVQTGVFESANLYDLMAVRRLETFSDRTGGAVYIPKSTAELDSAFAQISADLAQQYVLSYYPTDEGRDGRFRVINLRVKTRPNLRVRARRGYYPRLSAQQLSALPEHFTSTSDMQQEAASGSSQSTQADPAFTISRELAIRQARSTITLGSPAHGSKNMDAETSGDPPTRNELDVRVSPAAKPLEPKAAPKAEPKAEVKTEPPPAPQSEESPPESRLAVPDAKPSPPVTAPSRQASTDPNPTPTPAPTATQRTQTAAPEKGSGTTSPAATTQPSQQSTDGDATKTPLNVGLLNSKALSLPKPLYPEAARRMRLEGAVRVLVSVDESGKVVSARAESGHMILRGAAIEAARQARFAPVLVSGQPVPVSGFITYTFGL